MLEPVNAPQYLGFQKGASQRGAPSPLPVEHPDPNRVAVLLNRNARKVNDRLASKMERILGSDHLFYSRSLDEAEAYTREIVQRGYGTVLCGGGDGTLARTFNLVQRYIDESNQWRRERAVRFGERQALLGSPRFGLLKLGTGNGLSRVVGATGALNDLKTIVDYAPGRTHQMDLIESGTERFFFGGLGYDAMLLNDFNAVKQATSGRMFGTLLNGLPGYFAALFCRTLPRLLAGKGALEGRVVTRGRAYYIDPRRGDAAIEIEPGATLFEGKAQMIAAGTCPYYGYGFRIFPFANIRPGLMQLRVASVGPVKALANLGAAWRGSYRAPDQIFDFLVEDIGITLSGRFPYQHSGDAQGEIEAVDMRVSDTKLRLVDCHSPRPFLN